MLIPRKIAKHQYISLGKRRKNRFALLVLILCRRINGGISVEFHGVSAGAEDIIGCRKYHRLGRLDTCGHKAGHKPLPYEPIQLILLGGREDFAIAGVREMTVGRMASCPS